MIEVRITEAFATWLRGLRDERARARIAERLRRMALGNVGDVKSLGDGLSELRIDYGPGYRIYFVRKEDRIVVILAGGDKRRQSRDIEAAKALARELPS